LPSVKGGREKERKRGWEREREREGGVREKEGEAEGTSGDALAQPPLLHPGCRVP